MNTFEKALSEWIEAQRQLIVSREAYRLSKANHTLSVEGKTVDERKARVDLATSELRLGRDHDVLVAEAAYHAMIYLRGGTSEGQR